MRKRIVSSLPVGKKIALNLLQYFITSCKLIGEVIDELFFKEILFRFAQRRCAWPLPAALVAALGFVQDTGIVSEKTLRFSRKRLPRRNPVAKQFRINPKNL